MIKAIGIAGIIGVSGLLVGFVAPDWLVALSDVLPEDSATALTAGQTGALAGAAWFLKSLAGSVKTFVDSELKRRAAEDEHRKHEHDHWERLESLLSEALGLKVPQRGAPRNVIAGDITPRIVEVPHERRSSS